MEKNKIWRVESMEFIPDDSEIEDIDVDKDAED